MDSISSLLKRIFSERNIPEKQKRAYEGQITYVEFVNYLSPMDRVGVDWLVFNLQQYFKNPPIPEELAKIILPFDVVLIAPGIPPGDLHNPGIDKRYMAERESIPLRLLAKSDEKVAPLQWVMNSFENSQAIGGKFESDKFIPSNGGKPIEILTWENYYSFEEYVRRRNLPTDRTRNRFCVVLEDSIKLQELPIGT